jgi:hypothetical protein
VQTASARQVANGRQATAARVESPRPPRGPETRATWRWQYAAHPSLMPTVYVPGPVVTERKV